VKKIKLGAAIALLAALVLFLLQNLGTAEVSFLVWKADIPVAIPILVAFFIGGVAARPLIRFLNEQRRERRADKTAAKTAAKSAAISAAAELEKVGIVASGEADSQASSAS